MDFQERFADLEREHRGGNPFDRAYAFLDFHLQWAEALKETDPEGAIRQYSLAEECQWTIGTGATSGGEGLASMTAVYEIQGKRADVLERMADADSDAAASKRRWHEALAIWRKVLADPNGLSELTPAASKVRTLETKLAKCGC